MNAELLSSGSGLNDGDSADRAGASSRRFRRTLIGMSVLSTQADPAPIPRRELSVGTA